MSRRSATGTRSPARPLPAPSPAAYLKVRPLAPGDERTVAEVFERLGADARHGRFWRPVRALTPRDLGALADVDGCGRVAFVARTRTGESVAIGRYVAGPGDAASAEVALAVADEWRGRGVAGRLLRMLAIQARHAGIERLTASVPVADRPALRLFARHGFHREAADGVSVELARNLR